MSLASAVNGPWATDVLGRRQHASYLTKLLTRQFEAYHRNGDMGAVCLALDGDWGAGKTFFVQQWAADLANQEHPVIKFDAWRHDLTDEALIGFMSDLSDQLKIWIKKIPPLKRRTVNRKFQAFIKKAGRAVGPIAQEVAKGALKKVAGVSMDAVFEAGAVPDLEAAVGSSDWIGQTEKALDKFFETSLDAHSRRQEALSSLKETLAVLANELEAHGARLPIYIFVDELDRCRPDYAIRLLEGVKHLFDATGICFVFSTNTRQLAHSVKAVYGQGFDSAFYLKRFFTFEYALPDPDHKAFAKSLIKSSIFCTHYGIISGLPGANGPIGTAPKGAGGELAAASFALVAEAFRLDLRSQLQVLRLAEAATVEISEDENLHALYLFFLAAAFHRNREAFLKFDGEATSTEALAQIGYVGAGVYISVRDSGSNTGYSKRHVSLIDIVGVYRRLARNKVGTLMNKAMGRSDVRYPETVADSVLSPFFGRALNGSEVAPIAQYFDLVRFAGQTLIPPATP
jgi:hypothetical protein